jgi:hypothetical protein
VDAEAIKLEVIDAQLMVRRCTLANHKTVELQTHLLKQDIPYRIQRVDMKTYTYAQGTRNINVRNCASERELPRRIIVALVSNTSYNGSKATNPFNFRHYDMSSADINVDSKSVYGKPLTLDPANDHCALLELHHHAAMGFTNKDDGNGISRNEFASGYFNLPANLEPSLPNGDYEDPMQMGNVEIELTFSKPLPHTISVIIYMEYDSTITINSSRRATSNYA